MSQLAEAEVFFASDIHWQPATVAPTARAAPGGAPKPRDPTGLFGRFLADLAARAGSPSSAATRLYILGDLFDYWLEKSGQTFAFYDPHVEALERATAAGVEISLLFGNRDFTYRDALTTRCGVQILGDRAALSAKGLRISLHHGDLYCTGDWRYQLYRRVIRSWPSRLAMGMVPLDRAASIVAWMRDASEKEIGRKPAASMGIVDAAVAAEHRRGFDVVICGHVHQPTRRRVVGAPEGTTLVTLGAWDAEVGWYACLSEGEVTLKRYR